ncbi:MAG: prepilin peptidase CpaA [Sphingomonadales bacterium]|jgi:prepilin peptidase CpaA|nr:prepilin peptidase CpaA [Sphingomonadales bacterium]
MNGGFATILVVLLACGLVAGAVCDWRSRTIPNWLNAAIALGAIPFWWASALLFWPDIPLHVGVALGVFAIFALAFQLGMMGGGDVKMVAAVALWLPPLAVLQLLVIMSLAGGLLTVAMLVPHRMRKTAGQPEIPYGIAIAFAGMWLISERFLNQFV